MITKTPPMTASQARSFDRYSVANAAQVEHSLACGCQAYKDVFTYNRWKAQGFQVQRGQKAVKLPVIKDVEREDGDTGETRQVRILGTGAVFCRHQVQPSVPQADHKPEPAATPTAALPTQPAAPARFVANTMSTWQEV